MRSQQIAEIRYRTRYFDRWQPDASVLRWLAQMNTPEPSLRRAIAAPLCISFVLLASACAQSTPSGNLPTPSAATGTPAGDPVPSQLLGDWLMSAATAEAIAGAACPTPLAVTTCMFRLTFTSTTYNWTTNITGYTSGGGDVVVNGTEMDFFNGQACSLSPPQGIGRYRWTLSGSVLHFTSLNHDVCPRAAFLANQTYSRASG
jgi:hypothetical protein